MSSWFICLLKEIFYCMLGPSWLYVYPNILQYPVVATLSKHYVHSSNFCYLDDLQLHYTNLFFIDGCQLRRVCFNCIVKGYFTSFRTFLKTYIYLCLLHAFQPWLHVSLRTSKISSESCIMLWLSKSQTALLLLSPSVLYLITAPRENGANDLLFSSTYFYLLYVFPTLVGLAWWWLI